MLVNFRTFAKETNRNRYAADEKTSAPITFKGRCVVLVEDAGTPYDISLSCNKRFIPNNFSATSKNDHVVLNTGTDGRPTSLVLTSFDSLNRVKYRVELELDRDSNPVNLKFCLPPNSTPVSRVDELTDVRQTLNVVDDNQEIASVQDIEVALKDNPFLEEAFTSAEFHLTFAVGLLEQCVQRAKLFK